MTGASQIDRVAECSPEKAKHADRASEPEVADPMRAIELRSFPTWDQWLEMRRRRGRCGRASRAMPVTRAASVVPTLLLVLAVAAAGCASRRGPAAQVASSGTQAAATCMTSTQAVRSGLDAYVEAQYLRGGLLGLPDPPVADIDRVRVSLGLRLAALQALQNAYQEFESLAVYDAESEVRSATEELRTAVNEYAAAVNGAPALNEVAGVVAGRGLGLVARAEQNRRLKENSKALRGHVENLLAVVEAETVVYQGLAAARTTAQGALARDLFERNLSCPHPILTEYASGFGLEYDRESLRSSKTVACDSGKIAGLRAGIDKIIDGRVQRQIEAEKATLAQQQGALKSLIAAHMQLEGDQEITLDGLRGQLLAMREFADELRTARVADQALQAAP